MAVEGLFGTIIFGKALGRIETPSAINKKMSGRFGEHEVHLRKPLLEWGGNNLVEISMDFSLNSSWCGDPNWHLAEWHFYCENAIAAPLIMGTKPMGPGLSLFVVTEINEQHKHWLTGGKLISVDLSVSFKEYLPFSEGLLSALGLPSNIPGLGGLG